MEKKGVFMNFVFMVSLVMSFHFFNLVKAEVTPTTSPHTKVVAVTKIAPAELLKKMNPQSSVTIIDVRTAEEFQQGRVPGAVNLPHHDIGKTVAQTLIKKDQPAIVYCRSGKRASMAIKTLQDLGYNNIKHLDGDFLGWQSQELPIEK